MATETVTMLRDDIDGSSAERTLTFSWDGAGYEIDLSKKNLAEFEAILAPYLAAARRVGGRAARGRGPSRTARGRSGGGSARPGVDLTAVRVWASSNGHRVAERGRIAATVLDAYEAARDSGGRARPARASTRAAGRKPAAKAAAGRGARRAKSATKSA